MTDVTLGEWLFRSLCAEALLDDLESQGVSVRAASDQRAMQRVLPIDEFSQKIRQSAMQALPAYLAFFCLENAVRELIAERLAEAYGQDWWNDHASNQLKTKVEDRQNKEGRNRWHVRRGEHPIYYTDFGDLKSLLHNNWTMFEDLFPDRNWITGRIDELEASRNIIAHSNTLDEREMLRIRLYLQDWVRQVG